MRSRKLSEGGGEAEEEEDDTHSTHSFPQRKRRRGLSQFYSKAQSFCCLEEAFQTQHGASAAALEKKPKVHDTSNNASSLLPRQLTSSQSTPAQSHPIPTISRPAKADDPGQLSHSCPSSLSCLTDICSALEHSSLSGSESEEITRLATDRWPQGFASELQRLSVSASEQDSRGSRSQQRKPPTGPSQTAADKARRSLSVDRSSASTYYLP